jgi:hypothetical protein
MAPLKTISQEASLAITSARILVAVEICSSPPLSAIKPSRICSLTFSSWLGRDAFLAPLLNSRKPVLEGVHVAGRSAFTFQSCHARSILRQHDGRDTSDSIFSIYSGCLIPVRFVPRDRIHFPIVIQLWQSSGKVKKFDCVFSRLDALRGLTILVSVNSIGPLYRAMFPTTVRRLGLSKYKRESLFGPFRYVKSLTA